MRSNRRETLLKIVVAVVVGLFVFDRMILSPAINRWKEQGERIGSLRQKVQRGRQLLERERSVRARWSDMQRLDLPDDFSAAESDVYKAIGRWASQSRVGFTNLTPQRRSHEEGYDTYEWRASAVGDQASLSRLLYEIETDPLPANLEECELTARDPQGKQLSLAVKFSFIRIAETTRNPR